MTNLTVNKLQNDLCYLLCTEFKIVEKDRRLLIVETPFYFPDGDQYQIYIKELSGEKLRLTDMGHTLMHISYERNYHKKTIIRFLEQIKSTMFVNESEGEFYIDTEMEDMGLNIFKLAQVITMIYDISTH